MRKFWLAAMLFICSSSPVFAVSVTITSAPATVGDEEFSVNVTIDGAGNGTNYLRVDLYQDGSTNYFGETDNGSYWYSGSDGKQYAPIEIASGSAVKTVKAKVGDPTVGSYPGPGNYKLRVRRYTSSGNQASNDTHTPVSISITKAWPSPSPSPTPTPSPSVAPSPTPTPTPTATPKPSPSLKPSSSPSPSPSGEVAGTSSAEIDLSAFGVSPSPSPSSGEESPKLSLNQSRAKTALIVGFGLVLLSVASFFGYRQYLRRQSVTDL